MSWPDSEAGGGRRETRWLTPRSLVESLGPFDLDPAGAPGHELAARTYLPERGEDGTALPWSGRVWLNPPYGPEARAFMARMAIHGDGIALLPARTETRMFRDCVWSFASGVLFVFGRLVFLDAAGTRARANAGFGSVLVAYSPADLAALRASGIEGQVIEL